MNIFPKGLTSYFMMSHTEWNNDPWNLNKCIHVMPVNYIYNTINLTIILECRCVLFLQLRSTDRKYLINYYHSKI